MLKVEIDSCQFQIEGLQGKLKRVAHDSFELLRSVLSPEDRARTGVFIRVFVSDKPLSGVGDYHELLAFQLGFQADYQRWSRYKNFSYEKALRVMKNYVLYGHETSFESANPGYGEYQGAVLLSPVDDPVLGDSLSVIISSSALPAVADETLGLLIAGAMKWGTPEDYRAIAKLTGNNLFPQLMPQ